ncbi:pentatricopeptide repeat-containing protein At3g29290 [Euphorbia lathyris]|uniref:pentatricopeptide repeat-containing protein At3g29290 n=1 Tax=Euphorbia lathyris TaxID=212925 RepID=UPI003313A15F
MSFVHNSTLVPVMREVLGNSISGNFKPNGFAYQDSLYVSSTCGDRACRRSYNCGLCAISSMKMNRSIMRICEHNLASVSVKGYSWLRCVNMKIPKLSSIYSSSEMVNLVAVSNSVAGNTSVLVSEESEESDCIRKGNDEIDYSDNFMPPWGNLIDQDTDKGTEAESTLQPAVLSTNEDTINETRIHLLDERDEEELSRRILMLSRSSKVRSALELFRSMEYSGIQPNAHACNSLISCLLRKKLLDHAMSVFQFMMRNKISTGHTYTLVLKAVADIQGCDSSLDMFVKLGGFSRENNDFDVIVYNTMISVCGRINNWVETERIWRVMKEKDHHGTEVTYSLLISIFVRCCQNELALDAYREMDQNGIKLRGDTLQAVIGACTKEGKWELALNIFQHMLNRGLKPNRIACNALINSLGKSGEVKLAFKVFEIAKSLGHMPDTYTWNALLNGLYRANQYADAIQLFENIRREQSSQINEHLYNTALMSCQKLGLWDKAVQLLWQLEASELTVSTTSYNLVIGACEVARKPKVALQVYEHMAEQQCAPDTFTYLSIIRSCIWASLWDEVEEILVQVKPDVSLYNAVIHGMCLNGKVESAKKLYMKMRRRGLKPDGKTRALMLQNLRKFPVKRRRYYTRPRR